MTFPSLAEYKLSLLPPCYPGELDYFLLSKREGKHPLWKPVDIIWTCMQLKTKLSRFIKSNLLVLQNLIPEAVAPTLGGGGGGAGERHRCQKRKSCHSLPLLSKWVLWISDRVAEFPAVWLWGKSLQVTQVTVGSPDRCPISEVCAWLGEVLGHTYNRPNGGVHSQVLVLLPHFQSFIIAHCWLGTTPGNDSTHNAIIGCDLLRFICVSGGKNSKVENPTLTLEGVEWNWGIVNIRMYIFLVIYTYLISKRFDEVGRMEIREDSPHLWGELSFQCLWPSKSQATEEEMEKLAILPL